MNSPTRTRGQRTVHMSTVAAAAGMVVLTVGPAWAHVEVTPVEAPESSTQELVFGFHHGCGGLATTGLDIQMPPGVTVISAGGPDGWESIVTHDPDAGTVVTWSGPAVPDGQEAEFPLEVTLPVGAGTALYFPTVQRCGSDAENRWIEVPGDGQTTDDLEEPAPAVLLVANPDATTTTPPPTTTTTSTTATTTVPVETTTSAPASTTTEMPATTTTEAVGAGGGGAAPVAIALGVAAVAAAVLVVIRRRNL